VRPAKQRHERKRERERERTDDTSALNEVGELASHALGALTATHLALILLVEEVHLLDDVIVLRQVGASQTESTIDDQRRLCVKWRVERERERDSTY
jgi:hypothetical protein